jgi:hypothetical protein
MNKYFKKPICCVYLDQFATSSLFDTEKLPEWKEIRNLLTIGVQNNKVVCPLSTEHFFETSQKSEKKATYLDSEFYKLSKGYVFKQELFITSQLVISTIRGNNITEKTFLRENIRGNILSEKDNLQRFSDARNSLRTKVDEGTTLTNELRKISKEKNNITPELKYKFTELGKKIEVDNFIRRLNDLLKDDGIRIQGVSFPSGDVPYWFDSIIFRLIEVHKMTKKELKLLIKHLEVHGFDKIASLNIRTSLSAFMASLNKIEDLGDQIDIMRVSTALPISDIFFADKERKNEILALGLDKKYNTLVLCGSNNDLQICIEKLKEIVV